MNINFGDIAKKLGIAAAIANEDIAETFIRKWIISKLKDTSLNDLDYAVKHNYDLWDNATTKEKQFGFNLIQEYSEVYKKYSKMLNSDTIMMWLRKDRPEFWEYIMNDSSGKARSWLDGMVDKIHMRIWEKVNIEDDIKLNVKGDKK